MKLVIVITMFLAVCAMSPPPALADGDWDWSMSTKQVRAAQPRRHKRRYYRSVERKIAIPDWMSDDDGNRRPVCLDKFFEIVSTEHTSKAIALEAAKKLLMAEIQWKEGAQYLDLTLAQDYREHCGPSNPMDTMSTRINEAVNQVIGREGQNVRCVIRARPCRARLEKAEGK